MSEEVVARVNEVRLYFGEKPPAVGLPKGGQLVLTNRRIVFIKGLYGPVDLDWGLKIEGVLSFSKICWYLLSTSA